MLAFLVVAALLLSLAYLGLLIQGASRLENRLRGLVVETETHLALRHSAQMRLPKPEEEEDSEE